MANNCAFWGEVRGTKKDVEEFIKYFTTDYNYMIDENGEYINYPDHDHLQRIYDCYVNNSNGDEDDYCAYFSGDCAWSLLTAFDYQPLTEEQKKLQEKSSVSEDRRFVNFQTILDRLDDVSGYINSEELGMEFTERVEFYEGQYTMECEELTEIYLWFEDLCDGFEEFVDELNDMEKRILCDALEIDNLNDEEKFIKARDYFCEDSIKISDAEWIKDDYYFLFSPKNYQTVE